MRPWKIRRVTNKSYDKSVWKQMSKKNSGFVRDQAYTLPISSLQSWEKYAPVVKEYINLSACAKTWEKSQWYEHVHPFFL